ncbi:MAG: hypothetical protein H0U61_00380 [Nocardioidaceae bacterium]|nr:hypothetical protein [Nocardioidaceae bacterium]
MSDPSSDRSRHRGTHADVPDGVDPLGVPRPDTGRNAFIIAAAVVVATLALIFTLGWIVFHQLSQSDAQGSAPGGSFASAH